MRPEPGTLTIALAPDAALVIAGVTALLRSAGPDVTVVAVTDRIGHRTAHDVVLYDPLVWDPSTLPTPPRVLVAWSWSTRGDVATQARLQGAAALLSKHLPSVELLASLRSLRAGRSEGFVVGPTTDSDRPARSTRSDGLTGRELEMLQMIAEGRTNDEIARQLFLSINSVKTYIRTAYRKVGITRRPQAVLWGAHEGLAVRRQDTPIGPV